MPDDDLEPIWLTEEQVIGINKRLVAVSDEPHFLREPGLLASAVARPRHRWLYADRDIVSLAGALLLGIGRNHPFAQGNKRTAMAAAAVFLRLNGYSFVAPDVAPLGVFVERSIIGTIAESIFLETFRKCVITTEEWEAFLRTKIQPD